MKSRRRTVFPSILLCLVLVALTALPPAAAAAAPASRSLLSRATALPR